MQRATDCGMPNPRRYIYSTIPTPKSQVTLQKRIQKDYKSQRTKASAARYCLLQMIGKLQPGNFFLKYDCLLNITRTMTIPFDILTWRGEISQGTNPR